MHKQGSEGHEWITVTEAAKLASVTTPTIRRWADSGRIQARRTPGGHRQINQASLYQAIRPAHRTRHAAITRLGPTFGTNLITEWAEEAEQLDIWNPTNKTPLPELERALTQLRFVQETIESTRRYIERIIDEHPDRYQLTIGGVQIEERTPTQSSDLDHFMNHDFGGRFINLGEKHRSKSEEVSVEHTGRREPGP